MNHNTIAGLQLPDPATMSTADLAKLHDTLTAAARAIGWLHTASRKAKADPKWSTELRGNAARLWAADDNLKGFGPLNTEGTK